jgi:long-chain acyl-CoA synthetase
MNMPWIKTCAHGVPVEIDADAYPSVVALFDAAVARFADLPAFECLGSTMTYAEIDRASRAVAAYLQQELGVRRGDRVALMAPNVPAFPIVMLGVLRAGAAQVNVNPLYTPRELAHQLNDAGVETIVIFGGSTPTLAEIIDQTPVKTVITLDLGDGSGLAMPSPAVDPRLTSTLRLADVLAEGATLPFEPVALTGDDILFFQYTGGTTGRSKGAVLFHRNLVANIEQFKAFLPEATEPGREVLVLALPLYHIFGLMMMLAYASIGARAVLIPNPRDMDGFITAIKDAKFSVLPGVNTLFQGLTMHPRFREVDLSNYKIAIGGGSAVIKATSEKWKALTGHHIKEGYGLSETSPILCLNPISGSAFSGACGLPLPSTEIRLLDDEGREVAEGEAGEICARGPQVMQGYWNNEAANAAAFTDHGFFRTGDIGVFTEDGFVKIVDRKKDMILVSGFNVYPNEVEATVTACDGIAECACIGVADEKSGEAVRVYAVRAPGATISEADVIAHCRKELAGYKVPKQIVFVDALPKSTVGKILRRELRTREEKLAAPAGYSTATLRDYVGHDFGTSAPVMVGQPRIDGFAEVTGDHQWIHVDVERARVESPFGGPVAHGFLTLSLLAAAISEVGVVPSDAKGVINYGLDKVRFLAPVPAGAEVACCFRLAGVEDKGAGRQLLRLEAAVRIEGADKPAIVGEMLVLVVG